MFYRPSEGHGLPHNPFNAIVTPRPIGWISTRGADGRDNLAPYSFFNAVAYVPPQVMFASTSSKPDRGDTKDSVSNIRETGVFCVNIVEYAARDVMNKSSALVDRDIDEFEMAGIDKELVFVGAMDRFYVWDPERYAAFDAEMESQLDDVQADFEGSFNAALAVGGIRGVVGEGD